MPDPITATVVCHTEGCENEGIAIDAVWRVWDEASETWTESSVFVCGSCGQIITDVTTNDETAST
ncbi:MAG: hypothetical protein J2P17_33235 [Mycobacterium sp.]|nr:hypothetical protein [Mycobacterium sp.]